MGNVKKKIISSIACTQCGSVTTPARFPGLPLLPGGGGKPVQFPGPDKVACFCISRLSYYLSIVQINLFRPSRRHSATDSLSDLV